MIPTIALSAFSGTRENGTRNANAASVTTNSAHNAPPLDHAMSDGDVGKRHDDNRNLEALNENALEGDGKALHLFGTQARNFARVDRLLIVHRNTPGIA